jgi:hypothetical protein
MLNKVWHFASYFKRLLYKIFYIGPSMSPKFPYEARERSWRAEMCRGLIPGTIWKLLCHKLFITYLTLTFFKHWLFYCRKDLWTDKLRKLILRRVAFVQLANILVLPSGLKYYMLKYKERWCIKICIKSYVNQIHTFQNIGIKFKWLEAE